MKHLNFLITVICLFLVSCASFDHREKDISDLRQVLVDDIEASLVDNDPAGALQDIDYLARAGKVDLSVLNNLRERAIDLTRESMAQTVEAEKYEEAYSYYLTLQAALANYPVGHVEPLLAKWNPSRFFAMQAESRKEEGNALPGLLLYLRALETGYRDDAVIVGWLDLAESLDHFFAVAFILGEMKKNGMELPEPYIDWDKPVFAPSLMLGGTLTIWIDRGIKVERGIGYPDRVIGSGFFIDKRGYLVTNYHVIQSEVDPEYEGFSRLYIRPPQRSEEKIPAQVIAWDRVFDLALLKVPLTPEFVFDTTGAPEVMPGQKVFVIGSPIDPFLENTVTSGIVSATGRRRFLQMGDVIQVDAPVNPGNSGGPLIDEKGQLVGVVFAGFKPFEGLNFAIPLHWVTKLLPLLYAGDEVAVPWLGMALAENERGLEVIYAVPGEPAHRAGIEAGDIVKRINGTELAAVTDLQDFLLGYPVSSLLQLTWQREERTIEGLIAPSRRPFSPMELALERDAELKVLVPLFGMELKRVGKLLWETNYVVEKVINGSIADNTGLSENDPVNIRGWQVDKEQRLVLLQLFVKKKKAGFLESVINLVASLESDQFV
jgi:S1-C subfamily serine protease